MSSNQAQSLSNLPKGKLSSSILDVSRVVAIFQKVATELLHKLLHTRPRIILVLSNTCSNVAINNIESNKKRRQYNLICKKVATLLQCPKNLEYNGVSHVATRFATSQKIATKYFHFFINLFVINHAPQFTFVEGGDKK